MSFFIIGASSHFGSLPAGSIKFDTVTKVGGWNPPLDPSEDSEAIVWTYSNGCGGYNDYSYHYIAVGDFCPEVWFKDDYKSGLGSEITGEQAEFILNLSQ